MNIQWCKFLAKNVLQRRIENPIKHLRSSLHHENYHTLVRCLTWVRSRQNGIFHFVKTNHLYENGLISPRYDLTLAQVRSHLCGMVFLHANSFCWAVTPRQDCSFSFDSVYVCNYYVKSAIHLLKFSSVDVYW